MAAIEDDKVEGDRVEGDRVGGTIFTGDSVQNDYFNTGGNISVGNIGDSKAVAIGDGAGATVNYRFPAHQEQPQVNTLLDMIKSSKNIDEATKEKFATELDNYQNLAEESTKEALEQQKGEFDLWVQGEKDRLKRDMDTHQREFTLKESEQKTKRILRFFDRDLVAVIIGGVLLLIISIALILMIFSENVTVEASLLENAFLILLGFFFGQGAARTGKTTQEN